MISNSYKILIDDISSILRNYYYNVNLSDDVFILINEVISVGDVNMAYIIRCGYSDVFIIDKHLIISLYKVKNHKQIIKDEVIALFEVNSKFKRLILNNDTLINYEYIMYLQNQLQDILYHYEISNGEDISHAWPILSLTRDDLIIHQNGKKYVYRAMEIV